MAKAREYNPLTCIPSADVVEANLRQAEQSVRQLRVLLRTARSIEREKATPSKETARVS